MVFPLLSLKVLNRRSFCPTRGLADFARPHQSAGITSCDVGLPAQARKYLIAVLDNDHRSVLIGLNDAHEPYALATQVGEVVFKREAAKGIGLIAEPPYEVNGGGLP